VPRLKLNDCCVLLVFSSYVRRPRTLAGIELLLALECSPSYRQNAIQFIESKE
jgi:hypothetical protein